ncbi:MAG TPA: hypothetical protein VF371_04405, partial [Candidatus Limnocylindrales bacterium]
MLRPSFADVTSLGRKSSTNTRTRARWVAFGLFLALLAFGLVACGTAFAANASPTAPPQPLKPASLGADPVSLAGFLFTPIFQGLFLLL